MSPDALYLLAPIFTTIARLAAVWTYLSSHLPKTYNDATIVALLPVILNKGYIPKHFREDESYELKGSYKRE